MLRKSFTIRQKIQVMLCKLRERLGKGRFFFVVVVVVCLFLSRRRKFQSNV